MQWAWDPEKSRANRAKHKVSFELAVRIFGDPWIASRLDPHSKEERWQSIGRPSLDSLVTPFVVHTEPELVYDGGLQGRIISARLATKHERWVYEEGQF